MRKHFSRWEKQWAKGAAVATIALLLIELLVKGHL